MTTTPNPTAEQGCSNPKCPLSRAHSGPCAPEGWAPNPTAERECTISGCSRQHKARGYCGTHYRQFLRTSDPIASVVPPVDERFWSKVAKRESGCWEWTANRDNHGYGTIRIDGQMLRAHRWAYESENGPIPVGMVVDHLCHNRGCVNAAHLRVTTHDENTLNRPLVVDGVAVGPGVHGLPDGRFGAVAEVKGFPVTIGRFRSEREAREAVAKTEGVAA